MTDATSSPFVFPHPMPERSALRRTIGAFRHADETEVLEALLEVAELPSDKTDRVDEAARDLVRKVREGRIGQGGLDAFLHEYELSSREGIMLMCLAEALLRVPDSETADDLIKDKLGGADWERHLGHSKSVLVNASTFALMLTGRIVRMEDWAWSDMRGLLGKLVNRSGEPVIRQAMVQAMRIMGRQFVMGRTIDEALKRAKPSESKGYTYSYDMLGEAARTMADADRYFESYRDAIGRIGKASAGRGPIKGPGISVKLSALHPRYEFGHRDRVLGEIVPRLKTLAMEAKRQDIGFTVDAEEADRLDLSLDVIEAIALDKDLQGWNGFGLALQAYQKRALPTLDWLADLARRADRRLMVRLVKGAYWDTEIKRSQELGLPGYPVFTRKPSTDVSYIACAKTMLGDRKAFYSQFATHNAHTVAAIREIAGNDLDYEYQRLHGMGEALFEHVVPSDTMGVACRVYAPVGGHEDLLAYLVRRLLENGANTSFVNRIVDEQAPIAEIVADPVAKTRETEPKPHDAIPGPRSVFEPERPSAIGLDLTDEQVLLPLADAMAQAGCGRWTAGPIIGGVEGRDKPRQVFDPSDNRRVVGMAADASTADVDAAMGRAERAFESWDRTHADTRAACLDRMADLLEETMAEAMALCVREAGKSIPDAVAEVREAVDFCRYYAARARADFAEPVSLPGPTGETNQIRLSGRGVFVCISPWNFPLAIFCGQVTAALAAGNAVIAKPAEQTPLVAAYAVRLLHQAGVPADAVQLLPGPGETVGAALVADARLSGVAFTGSTETARRINRTLADRNGPIVPLIAETGGQNTMIVDSSALPEQVTRDVLISAFQSAGQRCSALRVMFVQDEIADSLARMIAGAMDELRIGDPGILATDVGPVIDRDAKAMLEAHAKKLKDFAKPIKILTPGEACKNGTFFAPQAHWIDGLHQLEREVFGPVLHMIRWKHADLDKVIAQINGTGYGLTCGVHTRIDSFAEYVTSRVRAGNCYVNRNIIGAIVGSQPFGGEGLSGTGPKAGGPRYLHRFAVERVISTDVTAAGGNTALMTM
jgi:RHH-type proline utilization regulon transcriptional repressor/proline dehydrogenase/delta 1-pyrroline-5-carboxylate dehydrogenase